MGELLRTGGLRVSSVGGKCLFLCILNAANHLHRLFFPIHPSVRKNRILFSLEKYEVFEVSPVSSCYRLLVAQCVKELLEIGREQPWVYLWFCHQAPPGWGLKLAGGMTKLFCCSFWDFKVCFGSMLQQKEKLLNAVCNISVCWNPSFWTAWVRISQGAARCKMAGDSFVLEEQRLGCILFAQPFSLTQHSWHQRKWHSCFVGQKKPPNSHLQKGFSP